MPEPSQFPPTLASPRRLPVPLSPRQLAARRVERECELDLANFGTLADARHKLRRTLHYHPDGSPGRRLSNRDAQALAWTAMSALASLTFGAGPHVADAVRHSLAGVEYTEADYDVVVAYATVANVAVRVAGSAA